MEKSINEILCIINEQFYLNLITLIGIDDDDLLLSGDEYGISWNIMTQNIRIYYNGLQISFLSKINILNDYSEVDKVQYDKLIENLISITDEEILDEIQKALQKYIVFERYEDAQKLKNFLDQFN